MTKFDDENDDAELLKDGQRLRIPLVMMDSIQRGIRDHFQARGFDAASYRPGYRIPARPSEDQLADANRNWRKPGAVEVIALDADVYAARETLADAYAEYQDRVSNAWRNAAPEPSMVDHDEPDEEPEQIDDAVDAREQAYRLYDEALRQAWKGGRDV